VSTNLPYTLCYTSGTTGDPKGAMLTHGNMMACMAGIQMSTLSFNSDDTHVSYLPMAHIYERAMYNLISI